MLVEYLQGTHLRWTKCGRRSPNHLETAKGNLKEVPPTALRGLISRLSLRRYSVGASKAGEAFCLELRMLVSDGFLYCTGVCYVGPTLAVRPHLPVVSAGAVALRRVCAKYAQPVYTLYVKPFVQRFFGTFTCTSSVGEVTYHGAAVLTEP